MEEQHRIVTGAADSIDRAAQVLTAGGLVVLPTDTVYGVSASLGRPDAIARLYFAKERPGDKAIPLLAADLGDLRRLAGDLRPEAERLIARFSGVALSARRFSAGEPRPRNGAVTRVVHSHIDCKRGSRDVRHHPAPRASIAGWA